MTAFGLHERSAVRLVRRWVLCGSRCQWLRHFTTRLFVMVACSTWWPGAASERSRSCVLCLIANLNRRRCCALTPPPCTQLRAESQSQPNPDVWYLNQLVRKLWDNPDARRYLQVCSKGAVGKLIDARPVVSHLLCSG